VVIGPFKTLADLTGRRGGLAARHCDTLRKVVDVVLFPGLFVMPNAIGENRPHNIAPAATECVVLLHGLGRTYRSMADMTEALEAAGYATANLNYPSRDYRIEVLANTVLPRGIDQCERQGASRIHAVTHSMGGILVRYYLAQHEMEQLARVVMLSPPNQGSEAAEALKDVPLYKWVNGPAGQQLGTGPGSLPVSLGPVHYPVGVITGNRAAFFDTWLAEMIPGESDGKVSVARAKVEGMTDFLVLPYAHPFIMTEPEVITQTLHFLQHGRFEREGVRTEFTP
jgi:pimeloyl-ACP methyl ester carboxylesterase